MRATSHAPPETSSATRSVASKLAANASSASGVMLTRPAARTTPSSQIATSQKSRCKSRPIARPVHLRNGCTCCTTITSLTSRRRREKQRANDTDRYVLAAQSGRVAGAATEKHGLAAHRPKRPAVCVLPEGPCPGSPDRTHGAGQSLQAPDFHAPRTGCRAAPLGGCCFISNCDRTGAVDREAAPGARVRPAPIYRLR